MIDLYNLQKEVYKNKVNKGFNVTDVNIEFNLIYGELAEAFESYNKNIGNIGSELADVAIYLLGLSEILGINLEEEIIKKHEINKKRKYKKSGDGHIKV